MKANLPSTHPSRRHFTRWILFAVLMPSLSWASGVVTSAKAVAKRRGIARQTPRVSITIKRIAFARRRLGRRELKRFSDWSDGRPETELNFKFYRQATNKIAGISDEAAAFLRGFF